MIKKVLCKLLADEIKQSQPNHKHYNLVCAWLNGEPIQRWSIVSQYKGKPYGVWIDVKYPHWDEHIVYRIHKHSNLYAINRVKRIKSTSRSYILVPTRQGQPADAIVTFKNGTPSSIELVKGAFI